MKRALLVALTLLALPDVLAAREGDPIQGDPQLGERLYLDGVLATGELLVASVDGALVVGPAFHCAACHRRSGFGSIEGAMASPSVVGDVLFTPRRLDRAELFRKLYQEDRAEPFSSRVRDPRLRPAYDTASLATALREGRDPSGREFDPWMPRYTIGDEDAAHLAAYLRQLGRVPDPGVEERRIHFATIVAPSADAAERDAFLAVMHAYVRRKNTELQGLLAHPGSSPWHRAPFANTWREWQLHVWQLEGAAQTWGEQLRALYSQRPVFAVLGGLVEGPFAPVHAFCEAHQVPCLFPHTDLPVTSSVGDYTLYLSRGLVGEAEALARYLETGEPMRVVQIYRDAERSRAPARAFAAAWDGPELIERRLSEDRALDWREITGTGADVLVAWLDESDLAAAEITARGLFPRGVYLSTTLVGVSPSFDAQLAEKIRLMHRFALPGREVPRIYRVRAWLRSRGVASPRYERLQLDTYFALSAADHALTHLVTRYDRDFFIESVEHEVENALNPGTYPRLSLGPGQRFASKGCWIVRLTDGDLEPVAGWIVR